MKIPIRCPKCASSIEISVDVETEKADLEDIRLLLRAWKHLRGVPDDDKTWDQTYFPRLAGKAKIILRLFENKVDDAVRCLDYVFNDFKKKGFHIQTLDGILKHADKYKLDMLERRVIDTNGQEIH